MTDRQSERTIYDDLDEDVAEAARKAELRERRRQGLVRAQSRADKEHLLKQPQFIRFLFAESERAGILSPTFHAQEASEQFAAGTRAFWLAMLRDLETIDPMVMVSVMMQRSQTLEKATHDDEHE